MSSTVTYETLDEVVGRLAAAIELRECGDRDGWDPAMDRRIRELERLLLEHVRHQPWLVTGAAFREAAAPIAGVGAAPR